jgi:hypothetical protein
VPKCTPDILVNAPEMAAVRLLHEATDATCFALLAEHPTLLSDYIIRPEPSTLSTARRVLSASSTLERAISRYVDAALPPIRSTTSRFDGHQMACSRLLTQVARTTCPRL